MPLLPWQHSKQEPLAACATNSTPAPVSPCCMLIMLMAAFQVSHAVCCMLLPHSVFPHGRPTLQSNLICGCCVSQQEAITCCCCHCAATSVLLHPLVTPADADAAAAALNQYAPPPPRPPPHAAAALLRCSPKSVCCCWPGLAWPSQQQHTGKAWEGLALPGSPPCCSSCCCCCC